MSKGKGGGERGTGGERKGKRKGREGLEGPPISCSHRAPEGLIRHWVSVETGNDWMKAVELLSNSYLATVAAAGDRKQIVLHLHCHQGSWQSRGDGKRGE